MIIVRMSGGLGNQIFQYATARSIALKNQTDLFFDCSYFRGISYRPLLFNRFNIVGDQISPDQEDWLNEPFLWSKPKKLVFRIAQKIPLVGRRPRYIVDKPPKFNNLVMRAPSNSYLVGYWQCHEYFSDIGDILGKELRPTEKLSNRSKEIVDIINSSNSVAISVRRGDYLLPHNSNFFGVCGKQYYQDAVQYILNQQSNVKIFLFSDDIRWVKSNLKFEAPCIYVEHTAAHEKHVDLFLMSRCQHFVISNSSFAWWGAWLGMNKNKIVVAPKKWYVSPSMDDKHLVPRDWVRL